MTVKEKELRHCPEHGTVPVEMRGTVVVYSCQDKHKPPKQHSKDRPPGRSARTTDR